MPRDNLAAFPPLPDPPRPFPSAPPLAVGLAELSGWWLDMRCGCGTGRSYQPLRLMAARQGWQTPLAAILPRLRCSKCGRRPSAVDLVADAARNAPGERLRLV